MVDEHREDRSCIMATEWEKLTRERTREVAYGKQELLPEIQMGVEGESRAGAKAMEEIGRAVV